MAGSAPAWLGALLEEEGFFAGCPLHEHRKKNEKNIFCLGCCRGICPHCASSSAHRSHPLLQVRRYVYHDVVRLDDLEKLIDCSYVQPYTINSAKVIFLKQRPQSRPSKGGSANICLTCDRILQEPFHFCSLSCKVDHVVLLRQDVSGILCRFDDSDAAFSHFESLHVGSSDLAEDDGRVTPSSIFEVPLHHHRSSSGGSTNSSGSGKGGCEDRPAVKKKGGGGGGGGGGGFLPHIVLSLGSRRKGAPHRSPLS